MKKLIGNSAAEKFENVDIKCSSDKDILTLEEVKNILEIVQDMIDKPTDEFGNIASEQEYTDEMDYSFEDRNDTDEFGELDDEDIEDCVLTFGDGIFDYLDNNDEELFIEDSDGGIEDDLFTEEYGNERSTPDVSMQNGCTSLFDLLESGADGSFIICHASVFNNSGEEIRYLVYNMAENSVEQLTYAEVEKLREKGEILNTVKDSFFE